MYKKIKDEITGKDLNIILKSNDGMNFNMSFPIDAENKDYKEYLKWLEDGNTPSLADMESLDSIRNRIKEKLKNTLKDNLLETNRTVEQIRTQWTNSKAAFENATTEQEVYDLYDNAVTWLGI